MKVRWRELIVSFLMALVLWYGVSGSEKLESHVEVRVDYRGLPQGLVVTNAQVSKVTVRVRASLGMLRSLAGRDYAFFMDLSDVQEGENVLPVSMANLPFRSGVEVIDVTPSRITLDVDRLETKSVPLKAEVSGDTPPDFVAHVSFSPSEVSVSGPSARLKNIEALLVPVPVEGPVVPGTIESKRLVPLPEGVDVNPTEVKQSVQMGIRRKLATVSRTVRVDSPAHLGKFVRPDKVTIVVAMPQSLAGKASSNNEIQAFVNLESQELGSYNLPVKVSLPAGAELVEIEPARVAITLEQKDTSTPKKK